VNAQPGPSHFGEAVQEAAEAVAQRLTVAALRRLGWTEQDLKGRRKGDPCKVKLAQQLPSCKLTSRAISLRRDRRAGFPKT
jgi:hypothetical protein